MSDSMGHLPVRFFRVGERKEMKTVLTVLGMAWILWFQGNRTSTMVSGHPTYEECISERETRFWLLVGRKNVESYDMETYSMTVRQEGQKPFSARLVCFPDTVDPRKE
jgi:hypothetical protein